MTSGEKQVWAVVFSREFRDSLRHVPSDIVRGDGDVWEEWEIQQAVGAAEWANTAVVRLRDAIPKIEEGFGDDSDVYEMALEMMGEKQ